MENQSPEHHIHETLKILERIGTSGSGNVAATNEIIFRFAFLLTKIAEVSTKNAAKVEKQTNSLIRLTRWIVALTVVLALLTAYLCYHEYRADTLVASPHQTNTSSTPK